MYTPFLRNLSSTHQHSIAFTGIRVSLYNAITEANTDTLVQFMEKFVSEAGSQASV
jgi:phosphoserine aminotransferase